MTRVFVSYSHDSPQHSDRVLAFANALRRDGIDAELDRYHVRPPKGWPHWCEEQLRPESSEFVVMICTSIYAKRVQDKVPADEGRGVFWEGSIIYDYIYDEKKNRRFIPVILDGSTDDAIPITVRNHTRYHIETFDLSDSQYEGLYRELTNQRAVLKPAVGAVLHLKPVSAAAPLPQRRVETTFAVVAPSRLLRGRNTGSPILVGREQQLKDLNEAWSGPQKRNVVTIVAWGGIGKTTLAAHWASSQLARPDQGQIERYLDWSFYSHGTRQEGDPTGADKTASTDLFFKTALEFFGDVSLATSGAGAWQKGERLAKLVAEHRTLLILDGLEPLQDIKTGALRDEALRSLLRGLAARNPGLCVVTTRQHLPDLDTWRVTAPEWELSRLSTATGAELLQKLGVNGTLKQREQLASDAKGHALTLTLIGKYLVAAHDGDIRKRDLISLTEADYEETRGHAFSVMAAYERWFGETEDRQIELAILRLLGLFDRPATPDCIAALRHSPTICGLTDVLVDASDARWNVAVSRLVHLGLIDEQPWERRSVVGYALEEAQQAKEGAELLGNPRELTTNSTVPLQGVALDAHPLVREHSAVRLRQTAPKAWKEAHARVFGYLRDSVPHWPEGLEGLQPLYQTITHGCHAGRYQETLENVFMARILRGTEGLYSFYSERLLGAISANLAAVSCFFTRPWSRAVEDISEPQQMWVMLFAAQALRALGRIHEAREPMHVGAEYRAAQQEWRGAATAFGNLAELNVVLGDFVSAKHAAERSITYADMSKDGFHQATKRATLAYVAHQAGNIDESQTLFEEAERILATEESYRYLYSFWGFHYCDLLLRTPARAAWQARLNEYIGDVDALQQACHEVAARVSTTLSWYRDSGSLLTVALDHLTLARAALYAHLLDLNADVDDPQPAPLIATAVEMLQKSAVMDEIPRALVTQAEYYVLHDDHDAARSVLSEAEDLASRGPMPLHRADICLTRARLFFRDDRTAARKDLRLARELIEKHGYLRRVEELQDAEKVIL